MTQNLPSTTPTSDPDELAEFKVEFKKLSHGLVHQLSRTGLSLSELSNPEIQRTLVDATMMDSMLNATQTTKGGDEVTDYKERRQAATAFAKMKGYDSGAGKRSRVLEEIAKMRRFLDATPVKTEEPSGE